MRAIAISEFEARIDEYLAAAEGGEEIVLNDADGRASVRLTGISGERAPRQPAVAAGMIALGRENLAPSGPTSAEEIGVGKNEGRR